MRCGASLGLVDRALSGWFYRLGGTIGRHPSYFLIVPAFLSLLAVTGVQQFQYLDDPEYLFSPETGRATLERAQARRLFPDNFTAFSTSRVIDPGQFVRLMVTSAEDGGDLLTEAAFKEIEQLDRIVREVKVDAGAEQWSYDELCARWNDKCLDNPAPRLLPHMEAVERRDINLTYPVWFSETFELFVLAQTLGSPVLERGTVVSAPALQMFYWAGNLTYFGVKLSLRWEEAVLRNLSHADQQFRNIRVARFGSQTLRTELDANTVSILPYLTVTTVLMVTFCTATTMMSDWVRSKPLLGVVGVVSATMASSTAFGILMYAGVPFIGLNLAAPFLMLGIGMDDTFVTLAAWRRTRIQDPVPRRMAEAYGESAVSITITSATNVISFLVGAISPFPSVRIFCTYTGLCVAMTYVWHVLFFGACMALSGNAERRNLHAITHRTVLPLSQAGHKSSWYRAFCSGGISADDPWNKIDNREHALMRFFRDGLAGALNMPAVKALVLTGFLLYLSVAVWGCSMVQEGLDKRRLAREDSYSVAAFDTEYKYFRDHPYRVQVIVEGKYDYSDPVVQEEIETLLQTFENSSFVEDSFYTESWLRDFLQFVDLNKDYNPMNLSTPEAWVQTMKENMLISSSSRYQNDVIFDVTDWRIMASRFIITTLNVNSTEDEKRVMLEMRDICDRSSLNCTVFNPLFVFFDQFVMVRGVSIQAISISAVSMCIVSLIFIPSPVCALWVAVSIVSIELGVIGFMTLWNVNLDCISMINLIMCIGFSVDFSAHISYAYMSARGLPADERVRRSLHALGLPIVQGGGSTILGVLSLFLSPSYIYITFFKTNFLVIMFGMMHGLFLLPVLLSLLGPGSRCCPSDIADISSEKKSATVVPEKQEAITPTKFVVLESPRGTLQRISPTTLPIRDTSPDEGLGAEAEAEGEGALVMAVRVLDDQVSAASSGDVGLGTSEEETSGSSSASVSETPPAKLRTCSGRADSCSPVPSCTDPRPVTEPQLRPVEGTLLPELRRNAYGRHSCPSLPTVPHNSSRGRHNPAYQPDSGEDSSRRPDADAGSSSSSSSSRAPIHLEPITGGGCVRPRHPSRPQLSTDQ